MGPVLVQGLKPVTNWLAKQPYITYVTMVMPVKPMNLEIAAAVHNPKSVAAQEQVSGIGKPGQQNEYFPLWKAGLTGEGQVVGVVDSGIDMDSCYFWDPAFVDYQHSNSTTKPSDGAPGIHMFMNHTHRKVVQYTFFMDGSGE